MAGYGPNGGIQGVSNATTPFSQAEVITAKTATGTFTTAALTTEVLTVVIAGGGNGGVGNTGGGGGGGRK